MSRGYVAELVLKERINTGDFAFREYEVKVVQGCVSTPSSPEEMATLALSAVKLDPSRIDASKEVRGKVAVSVTKKVLGS